jgi:hypothetical protein
MSVSVEDRFESRRTTIAATNARRITNPGGPPVPTHGLRGTPESLLPSDFERAVIDTAAHARYGGGCEALLRRKCRWCAIGGGGLLTFALGVVVYLPAPWLAAVPAAFAILTGWRWAVLSAAADELHAESAG